MAAFPHPAAQGICILTTVSVEGAAVPHRGFQMVMVPQAGRCIWQAYIWNEAVTLSSTTARLGKKTWTPQIQKDLVPSPLSLIIHDNLSCSQGCLPHPLITYKAKIRSGRPEIPDFSSLSQLKEPGTVKGNQLLLQKFSEPADFTIQDHLNFECIWQLIFILLYHTDSWRNVGHMTFSGAMIWQINRTFYSYVKNWESRTSLHRQTNDLHYNSCSSQICLFGINSFKVLARAKFLFPSHISYDQTSLYRQKLGHGWSEKDKPRVYWVIKHIFQIMYNPLSIQYISFFQSFLKGRSPISDDIFHIIPFHCYLHYSQHSSMKYQEMRGEGKQAEERIQKRGTGRRC